jgi:hypothetical protein
VHSRAARRAGSPTIDVGKVPATPAKPTYTPHVTSSGGIRKKKISLTRNQKLRRIKGVEKADVVAARTEIKKEKSLSKLRTVKDRAKDWQDVNTGGKKKKPNGFTVLSGMDLDGEKEGMLPSQKALPLRVLDEPVAAPAPASETEPKLEQIRESTVRFADDHMAPDDI